MGKRPTDTRLVRQEQRHATERPHPLVKTTEQRICSSDQMKNHGSYSWRPQYGRGAIAVL